MKYVAVALLVALLLLPAPVTAREALTDHPLVSPYEGSTLRRKDVKEFDAYNAFMGMNDAGTEPVGLALEGTVSRLFYGNPPDRSVLEIFRNYEDALAAAGAEVLFTCDQEKQECAKRYAGPTMQKFSGLHAVSNTAGRYVLGKIDQGDRTAYVAIGVGVTFTDVHVVEVRAMERGKVALDAAALSAGLDARGFVVVEGIYFDTDAATLKPESDAALAEVAGLLGARPELSVYVVGHTDMQGSFAHNRDLSQRRADAVVQALVERHGIDRARLDGHGVGPLAPQASNRDEGGRGRNRRVVIVAR